MTEKVKQALEQAIAAAESHYDGRVSIPLAEWSNLVGAIRELPSSNELDIGPPAPGEGDDLDNPEIGMRC